MNAMNTMNAINTVHQTKGDLVLLGGQILFDELDSTSIFQLLAGEVLILCDGQAVDLVEAGEVIDAGIWRNATAVAWTDCVLQTIELKPRMTVPQTNITTIERHLALAA